MRNIREVARGFKSCVPFGICQQTMTRGNALKEVGGMFLPIIGVSEFLQALESSSSELGQIVIVWSHRSDVVSNRK
jgi:hypothetical protein